MAHQSVLILSLILALFPRTPLAAEVHRGMVTDPRGDAEVSPAADLRRIAAVWSAEGQAEIALLSAGLLADGPPVTYWVALTADGRAEAITQLPAVLQDALDGVTVTHLVFARTHPVEGACGDLLLPARLITAEGERQADAASFDTLCKTFSALDAATGTYRDATVPSVQRVTFTLSDTLFPDATRLRLRAVATVNDESTRFDVTKEISITPRR